MPRALVPLLLLAAALPPAALALGGSCAVGPPLAMLQNDAGSGRDAGDVPAGALPLARDGHFWGSLDPPVQYALQDQHDWFAVDVPAGARAITVEVKSLGKAISGDLDWPFVYWLEVYRGDERPAFLGSWEDPFTFASPGGERLLLDVYIVPIVWDDLCEPAAWAGPSAAALPAEPQLYRVLFDCEPACAP